MAWLSDLLEDYKLLATGVTALARLLACSESVVDFMTQRTFNISVAARLSAKKLMDTQVT